MLTAGAAVRLAPPENGGTRHPGSRARRRSTQRKRRSVLSPSARRSPRRKGWDPECPSSPTGQSALNATQRPHDVARSHACLISNLCSHGTRFHASLADTRTLLHDRLHRLYPSQDSFVRGCIRLPFFDFELDPNRDCELAHSIFSNDGHSCGRISKGSGTERTA